MKELLKALAKFQQETPPITKDATNPFYKSNYASLEHIQEHIKPYLFNCNLVVIQKNISDEKGLFVETKVYHVESGENESSIFPIIVSKNDAQSYGSAVSYAKRYSLSGILNLTIQGLDDDGEKNRKDKKELDLPKIEMLNEVTYKKALASDKKEAVKATIEKYTKDGFGINSEWKTNLENHLKTLK